MTKKCQFNECDNPSRARGYCVGHYRQLLRGQELRRLHGGRYRDHKICAKCGQDKHLSEYHPQNTGWVRSRCKVCHRQDANERNARKRALAAQGQDL